MKLINTAKRYKAIGPYSQAVKVGTLLYCSGVIGVDAHGVLADGLVKQTEEIFQNIADILAQENMTLKDVVKTTNFLADMSEFAQFNELYAQAFGDHRPARSTVQVARLPRDARVEIECIASIPK
ncbi:MAG: Rid family detoxifying hydrolase [Candidatus Roizmanbacteria bacterium]